MEREELIARIKNIRRLRKEADLAFYAYRDLDLTEPEPFLLAAMERSPVSIAGAKKLKDDEILAAIEKMPDQSIYDEDTRLAQPDEVWNFQRGDGLEKALLLANIFHQRRPDEKTAVTITSDQARLDAGEKQFVFPTSKNVRPQQWNLSNPAMANRV
jgi:hypothetical protein